MTLQENTAREEEEVDRRFPPQNRPTASGTSNRRPSTLPSQYTFTPANPDAPETQQSPVNPVALESQPPTHRDYPPPTQLFQSGDDSPRGSGSHPFRASGSTQVRGSGSVQGRGSVGSIHRLASRSNQPPAPVQPPASTQPAASNRQIPSRQQRPSPQPRASVSHHSSQAQNSHEESEDEEAEGRELYTTLISPTLEPGTTWFGKDKGKLTRKVTKCFTNKFDGPYYNWSCVPTGRRERYFLEFAKTHTWHPSVTGVVEAKFYKIIALRMKDMVSKAGSKSPRVRPYWIEKTLWREMCKYWDTEEAQAKSSTTSAARMSDRNGLGPHKHVSGPKSFLQVEQEMEVELGRPPTIGEVFIRTHTKKDGTFVDRKAQEIHEAYLKNKAAKLAALQENDEHDDGNSRQSELSQEEDDEIFLQSTVTNDRGDYFGIGSLGVYINGKRKYAGSSSSFTTLQSQLEDANRKIEEQAALQAAREAEALRVAASQAAEIKHLSMVKKYLSETDPNFLAFLNSQSTPAADDHSEVQPNPTPAANADGTTPAT
ncbi:putative transposase Ptta/En/Spm plant [Arabidopsis thaliana x Arabidopsis arenosa]|uniref:Putative transposase Ptta/En/Spm plant n=1 Tax=Arabidopsis thaliana x Arabidopsis arenosa TaxID=1240361 RepID=A0A8T2B116_9BRAS|nr:putative transposase Ptta/En/Spm plant [Arabidopsis thaliana x Arabidopsis arenosa]